MFVKVFYGSFEGGGRQKPKPQRIQDGGLDSAWRGGVRLRDFLVHGVKVWWVVEKVKLYNILYISLVSGGYIRYVI